MSELETDIERRIAAAEEAWQRQRAGDRRAFNAKVRACADARDAGLSHSEIARALNAGRRRVEPHAVSYDKRCVPGILSNGYPEDEPEAPAA